ncbi:MAG: DUF4238 domain-containing protein [Candidatus Borkfalkiaceae bacterium]|nr:DUF4238 domain-containing protein [Christensenellaceae bacterium]
MFDRNHYIQNRLLKNFATKSDNGKYKICVLDLINFAVNYRNTESAFYEKNIYDLHTGTDTKELEIKFNEIIEKPMVELFERICSAKSEVVFTRKELITIKKYFLLQHYRTPKNKTNYTIPRDGFKLSQFNIQQGETEEDFWKREMLTILDSKWSDLLQSEMVGIRKHAIDTNSSFIMIIKSENEFCINDIGYVTERIPVQIPKDREQEYIKSAKEIGKQLYGRDNFDEVARREIANKSSYFDNFELYPVSSNYAILFVSPVWKYVLLEPKIIQEMSLFSPILMKYLILPKNDYVNADKIKTQKDLESFMDENDKYTYQIQTITEEETIYLNTLTMNEAYCYVGVKTPKIFIPSVQMYNYLMSNGEKNIHHNYNGFVELLSKI